MKLGNRLVEDAQFHVSSHPLKDMVGDGRGSGWIGVPLS